MSSKTFIRKPPIYSPQSQSNTCWAACLSMWIQSEVGLVYQEADIVASAPAFSLGGGGIDTYALSGTIGYFLRNTLVSMYAVQALSTGQMPLIESIIRDIGCIYVAYTRQDGSGHVNIIYGFGGDSLFVLDPDRRIGDSVTNYGTLFAAFPAFIGWRYYSKGDFISNNGQITIAPNSAWDYSPNAEGRIC